MPKVQAVTYVSKVWVEEEKQTSIEKLITRIGYKWIGEVGPDDFIIQRRGIRGPIFHLLHISWGDRNQVAKYKLFRINPFEIESYKAMMKDYS